MSPDLSRFRDDKGESDASIESGCWMGAQRSGRTAVSLCLRVVQPPKIAKPYRLIQIVDTPESSETGFNTVLVGTPQQTNRTVVMLSPDYPRVFEVPISSLEDYEVAAVTMA